jgi:hypothetical protein
MLLSFLGLSGLGDFLLIADSTGLSLMVGSYKREKNY